MSSDQIAIRVHELGKCYQIYNRPQDRLKQSLVPRLRRLLGQPAPDYFREFWALRDVSFEVRKGETVGIIGRNGSGKSTLLQIICGTLTPTIGTVETNGRVAALLELGAGFNPEFTGRENVYLNASVLGLSTEEIDTRFDAIAAFADIGQFIEQPVKTYSSGMYVRLAFGIQTVVEPEILVVDEALAVGDVAFTAKCMRRMNQLVQNGTTILFVSHDVSSVRQLCSAAIWLDHGKVQHSADAASVTAAYLEFCFGGSWRALGSSEEGTNINVPAKAFVEEANQTSCTETRSFGQSLAGQDSHFIRWGDGGVRFVSATLSGSALSAPGLLLYGEPVTINVQAKFNRTLAAGAYGFGFSFRTPKGIDVLCETTLDRGVLFPDAAAGDEIELEFRLQNILAPGDYFLTLQAETREDGVPRYYEFIEDALQFKVIAERSIFSLALPPIEIRSRHITT